MINYIKLIVISSIVFLFSACESSEYISQKSSIALNGIVVDGYISGATVCLDYNLDALCNSDEPSTTTNNDGVFNFPSIDNSEDVFVPLIAHNGIDMSTQKTFLGEMKTLVNLSTLDENSNIIISPLSDLVASSSLSSDLNLSTAFESAKTIVANVLGLSLTDLNKDPMKDITIFTKSQELQHTKQLIEVSAIKHIPTALSSEEEKLLHQQLKQELLNQNLNLSRVLIAMEIYLDITIPQNEKTFILAQIQELKNSLNTLSQDTSLEVDNLNRLQKSIDTKQTLAIEALLDANESVVLEVIPLDITTESITQTIFDSTNALLDTQACEATNGYNMIANSTFQADKSEDSINGISLVSEYPRGEGISDSEVEIFYPLLETTLTSESVIVFQDNYYFVFDKAWINNSEKTIYVRTPKDENSLYGCYRFELNFTTSSSVKGTKVFRYSDI